jgi:RHS repeat-associated protein
MTDEAGSEAWAYDKLGRVLRDRRTVTSVTKDSNYVYNLAGMVSSVDYPSGGTLEYSYSTAGRVTEIPRHLINILYAPHGAPVDYTLMDYDRTRVQLSYDSRLRPSRYWTTNSRAGSVLDLSYAYFANGNVNTVTNNLVPGRTLTATYDYLNRVKTAETTANSGDDCWKQEMTYDRWGNLTTVQSTKPGCAAPTLSVTMDPYNKNRFAGYGYDNAGNMTSDGMSTYSWNAENRLVADGSETYLHDGDGRRLKVVGTNTRIEYRGSGGEILAEVAADGTVQTEFVYLNGKMVAQYYLPWNGYTWYLHADQVGSNRVMTNYMGGPSWQREYYTWGGDRQVGSQEWNWDYKFTGMFRGGPGNLDYTLNRRYSSRAGRWMSPDPMGGHTEDPQTLNRYVYARNNPLRIIDPTGLDFYLACADPINYAGCTSVNIGGTDVWVEADKNGNATIITSDSIRAGENTANVTENGVQINGNNQGIYFDNPASRRTDATGRVIENRNPIDLQGQGRLEDFEFHVDSSDPRRGNLAAGTFKFNDTRDNTRQTLDARGAFRAVADRRWLFGRSLDELVFHPDSTQHRFGRGPSPHMSVPDDPANQVPTTGQFHIDSGVGARHAGCAWFGVSCQ